jgi:DNA-binding Lrp family transcriptional regulator
MGQSSTSGVKLEAAERTAEILRLRVEGLAFEKIAERVSVSPETARRTVKRALDRLSKEITQETERIRSFEAARLNRLEATFWPSAIGGTRTIRVPISGEWAEVEVPPSIEAAELILKIMQRRADLLGLSKIEGKGKDDEIPPIFTLLLGDEAIGVRFRGGKAKEIPEAPEELPEPEEGADDVLDDDPTDSEG